MATDLDPDQSKKQCSRCGQVRPVVDFFPSAGYRDGWTSRCKPCMAVASRDRDARLRGKALEALGGRCTRCGIDDPRVLVVDHPDGGGRTDRARFSRPGRFYDYVSQHPDEYQALCHNCNHLKRLALREHRRGQYSDEIYLREPDLREPDRASALRASWNDPGYRERQHSSRHASWSGDVGKRRRQASRAAAVERRAQLVARIEAARSDPQSGNWGAGYAVCNGCGRSDRPHKGHGLCGACFAALRRLAS